MHLEEEKRFLENLIGCHFRGINHVLKRPNLKNTLFARNFSSRLKTDENIPGSSNEIHAFCEDSVKNQIVNFLKLSRIRLPILNEERKLMKKETTENSRPNFLSPISDPIFCC